MANRRLYQFLYSKQPKLTVINGSFMVGASGSVASASIVGAGVYAVSQLAAGVYQIKLADNYQTLLDAQFQAIQGAGASAVNVASLTASSVYQIAVVGNSNWNTVGLDSDYTASVGAPFVATNVAGSGTGTAKLMGTSGIDAFELIGSQSSLLQNNNPSQGRGSSVLFQCSAGIGSNSALFATNPVSSSQISFKLWFRDSSVTGL